MILCVAAAKGGVGKSTSAIHLAEVLAASGPTLLADDDPNRSATRWATRGPGLPFRVEDRQTAARHVHDFEHVVIDTPAGADGLAALAETCDVLVIPTTADVLALEAVTLTVDALRALGDRVRIVLTLTPPPPSRDAENARAVLREAGLVVCRTAIPRLVAFQHAALAGVTVAALPGPRAARGAIAYRRLLKELAR